MKNSLLFITLILSNLCYSQEAMVRNYLYAYNDIVQVQIYEVNYNDTKIDSSLKESLYYDTLGRLVEKRFDYNKLNTLYVAHKYVYNDNGGYSFRIENPYVLYDVSFNIDTLKNKQIYYDERYNRISYEILDFKNNSINQRIDYKYNLDGFLTEKIRSSEGKVVSKYVYSYLKKIKY